MGDFRSLTLYVADPTVNLTVAAVLISGGLVFVVLSYLFRPRRYTLHMRVVLTTTAVLIVLGTTLILLLESSNAATLGTLPWGARLLAAFFQSVTPRTAGFNTIETGSLREPTLMLIIALMFIGASPGGTGGGIKTTTFRAPIAVMLSMLRGPPRPRPVPRRRPPIVLHKAVTIALLDRKSTRL